MVITFVRKRKTQKHLVFIFGMLILVIIVVFSVKFLKKEEIFVSRPLVLKRLPEIKINFEVLEDPIFQKLSRSFPGLPSLPSVEKVGRENPFLSYEEKVFEE